MDIQIIQNKIYEIRGQRVMLDFDLAELYQVPTKVLKQASLNTVHSSVTSPELFFERKVMPFG